MVIPALNEERGIDAILRRVLGQREELARAGVSGLEVIVVDDGSKEGTAERVTAYGDVRLIRHPANKGYGAAPKTGLGPSRYYLQHRSLQEDMIYRLFAVLIMSVAGVNVLAFGLTCAAILGLLPARPRPCHAAGGGS